MKAILFGAAAAFITLSPLAAQAQGIGLSIEAPRERVYVDRDRDRHRDRDWRRDDHRRVIIREGRSSAERCRTIREVSWRNGRKITETRRICR